MLLNRHASGTSSATGHIRASILWCFAFYQYSVRQCTQKIPFPYIHISIHNELYSIFGTVDQPKETAHTTIKAHLHVTREAETTSALGWKKTCS